MRLYGRKSLFNDAMFSFEQARKRLYFHLGEFHPLNALVYTAFGDLYSEAGSPEGALTLY